MRNWMVAGPLSVAADSAAKPAHDQQQRFFMQNHLASMPGNVDALPAADVQGHKLSWQFVSSPTDQVTFDTLFKNIDFASAIAAAEIVSDKGKTVLLGLGSDDAVKVYLNGNLVHQNWIGRGVNADDDVVKLDLKKGRNVLLIEVQDSEGGWGFIARPLDKSVVTEKLTSAASSGHLEKIRVLLEAGADVNAADKRGLTALQAAHMSGRKGVAKFLADKGARLTPIPSAAKLIDGLYANLTPENRPGIAVLVSKDGQIVYKKGFGYANIAERKAITPNTKFRIGSITKQFTAAAILKLQEQGKLKISDPVSNFMPDFPRGKEVTIHHLLTHTSGIHSFTSTDSFLAKVVDPISEQDMVKYIKTLPYDFNPGERYEYNNSGYFIAGHIVHLVSGQQLGDFLKQNFFDPIGMKNTGMHSSDLKLDEEAIGYTKTTKYDTALDWDMSWAGGAGALYSTVEDLYKWNEAVFNGKVLSDASIKSAFTPVKLNNGSTPPGVDYGYGWGMSKHRGAASMGHAGGLHGFVSQLVRFPEEKLTIVMLTNQTPVEVELNPARIAELYLWQKLDTQETYDTRDVKIAKLEDYDGRYDLGQNLVLLITHEGSSLFAQVVGQGKYEIFPLKEDEFFWKVVEAKVKFNRDENGEVKSASFEQGAFKANAERKKE